LKKREQDTEEEGFDLNRLTYRGKSKKKGTAMTETFQQRKKPPGK